MAQKKTPGVYIVEKNAFPNSVIEVPTAVPAFIGYTEKANNRGKSLLNKLTRITSLGEYMQFYGGAPKYQYLLTEEKQEGLVSDFIIKDKTYYLKSSGGKHNLFNSIRLFFQNGGGPCYINSVGTYSDAIDIESLMGKGIPPLVKEDEPTMVIIPEAIHLKNDDCIALQKAVLKHCGKMQNRVAILDIYDGYKERKDPSGDVIDNFRNSIGIDSLSYGAAYYPWLNTTIVGDSELGILNLTNESLVVLQSLMMKELNLPQAAGENESVKTTELRALLARIPNINNEDGPSVDELKKALLNISPTFNNILIDIKNQLNLLAPSAAMAGVFTVVDNNRGVWKAPANISLNSVSSPAVQISHDEQEDLNITLSGKSINAIRSFIGEGVLVWGARTLDGNSNDWRYINVRRTMIMLEQSLKFAAKAYVFKSNNAHTWASMKTMIENFFHNKWKEGALVGSSPEEAYSVNIGLGSTMTPEDILEGILRISVLVAVSRPAEFIEITFQQQMQKS